ncbi:M4 family metallopeptidase [Catellatospora tritici]|uniref:M4 family metallopeptidase n=1 Tax=Catellatospora tritici TaxID=2851566 RepID=UPI001C2D6413|nr:M4 family metallopeptidase [Catellatospora tritici]MBV1855746.1 M4 family metallopeptidase [Catellatospora tritici]
MRRTGASMGAAAIACAFAAVAITTTDPAAAAAPAASVVTQETAIARAEVALKTRREALAATEEDEFHVVRTIVDPDGASHVRYARTYQGLRVYGGDTVVHNRPDGSYADSSVGLAGPLRLDVRPVIAEWDAAEIASRHFRGRVDTVGDPVLVVEAADGFGRLAYETMVSGTGVDGQMPSVLHVFVDAITGEVIRSSDEIEPIIFVPVDGTGNTVYSGTVTLHATYTDLYVGTGARLIDSQAGGGRTCDMGNGTGKCSDPLLGQDGVWGDRTVADRLSAAADAHYGAATAYDYFKNVHGHVGIFGDGSGALSRTHFGTNVSNAFWNGPARTMTFGDGENNQHPFVTVDVVGHEMTHGVTDALAGLIYSGESGGLNEATSDIFGTAIEFYAANANDPGDYEIGEKIDNYGTGGAIRYMYNPWQGGFSLNCWDTSAANIDVHQSSGPADHFFFNLAEGSGETPYGNSRLCGNAPPVTGIGRDAAERIWFRALNVYFTSNTSYVNPANPANTARAYTLKAAADLYGKCSPQVKAVHAAWVAVNVPGSIHCFNFQVDLDHLVFLVGESGTVPIQTYTDPDTEPVTLVFSATGLPEGTQATFEPKEVRAGEKLAMIIQIPAFARPGSYQITVTATSKDGPLSATLPLTIVDRR